MRISTRFALAAGIAAMLGGCASGGILNREKPEVISHLAAGGAENVGEGLA